MTAAGRRIRTSRLLLTFCSLSFVVTSAQEPAFEAVSIKPNVSGERDSDGGWQGSTWRLQNVPARSLIMAGFQVLDGQIIGGPSWISSDRFDVSAKPPTASHPDRDTLSAMVRTMLVDRFHLKTHTDQRQLDAMALTLEKPNGTLAAGLKRLPDEACPAPTKDTPRDPTCAMNVGRGLYKAHGATIGDLVAILRVTYRVAPLIVDKTGMAGKYDVDLSFTPENALAQNPDGVPLATALRDQLGLRLQPMRLPVDVIVIDSISRPDPN